MSLNAAAMTHYQNQPLYAPSERPVGGLAPGGPIDRSSKLYQAAQDFEALFVKQMLNTMRKTVDKGELFNGGQAEEIFEDMLYDERAKMMTRNAGFGLADSLYRQMAALQEIPRVPT